MDPTVGRFTQEDTYRGDGLNLYSYVANNPVNYIDPTGHCKKSKKDNPYNFNPDDYEHVGTGVYAVEMYRNKKTGAYFQGNPYSVDLRSGTEMLEDTLKDPGLDLALTTMTHSNIGSLKKGQAIKQIENKVDDYEIVTTNIDDIKKMGLQAFSKKPIEIDIPKSVERVAKKLSPEAKKGYKKAIEALKSGDTRGLNEHALKGGRKGQWAVDIKGTGKGRGAGRIIFEKISDGSIKLIEILTDHRY